MAISHFVANYLRQHSCLQPHVQGSSGSNTPMKARDNNIPVEAGPHAAPSTMEAGPPSTLHHGPGCSSQCCLLPPVHVVPLSAWGVFGQPPFRDLGAAVVPCLGAYLAGKWRALLACPPVRPPVCLGVGARIRQEKRGGHVAADDGANVGGMGEIAVAADDGAWGAWGK